MKKVIIFSCLGVLFLAGLISTTAFVVLYLNSQKDLNLVAAELKACNAERVTGGVTCPTTTTGTTSTTPTEVKFVDDNQGISVTYPLTWTGTLTTKISDDFAYEPSYGKVISQYEYNLVKSGADLKFKMVLAGIDGFPNGLKASENDIKEFAGTDLVRYSLKGANDWKYVSKTDCSSLTEMDPSVDVSQFQVCVGPFFPGFSTKNASFVTIKTGDSAILTEADAIAVSALN